MKKKKVRYTRKTLPPLTDKQRASLKALAARPDSEIDYSDIPQLSDELWKKAVRGRFYKPGEASDHGTAGRRCPGMAAQPGEGLPIAYQRDFAPGNAQIAQVNDVRQLERAIARRAAREANREFASDIESIAAMVEMGEFERFVPNLLNDLGVA
jgi:hypothetical protein